MKQIFAFILSLSFLVVAASANCTATTTSINCTTVFAKDNVCKNNDHKFFAHCNTNTHQQPVGKTKVSKSSFGGFIKENISIPSFANTSISETLFSGYKTIQPSRKLYMLHCSYLL